MLFPLVGELAGQPQKPLLPVTALPRGFAIACTRPFLALKWPLKVFARLLSEEAKRRP